MGGAYSGGHRFLAVPYDDPDNPTAKSVFEGGCSSLAGNGNEMEVPTKRKLSHCPPASGETAKSKNEGTNSKLLSSDLITRI